MKPADAMQAVRRLVLDDPGFVRLMLAEPAPGGEPLRHAPAGGPWIKVSARPVEIRGRRLWQFSFFDGRKDVSKNWERPKAEALLDGLLGRFRRVHAQAASGDLHVRVSKKGKVLATCGKPSAPVPPDARHNRAKRQPLPADKPDEFLMALGVMDRNGRVKPTMQGKFRQINEFLRQLGQVLPPGGGAARIVDCGCGSAWLTFAAWRYLTASLGRAAWVEGVDANAELVAKCQRLREALGWPGGEGDHGGGGGAAGGLAFWVSPIREYAPAFAPDCVLSLHACDTATDEAVAGAVRWGARAVLAAPCCQHELRPMLKVAHLRGLTRHGILKDRLADLLTDAFRAAALRVMGYRASVVEFVDPEHTAKNLLLRAEKRTRPGGEEAIAEWKALEDFAGAAPAIKAMLGGEFASWVG